MLHASPRAARGTLLFRTWAEARALWLRLVAGPRFLSLALMPDHVHVQLTDASQVAPLAMALRSYARWRNAARGESGAVWEHGGRPTEIRGKDHVQRTIRYIHLNPCRRGLAADPLAWAFSTHRDALGLALPPARRTVPDPVRFHAWVSGDPSVGTAGSPIPQRAPAGGVPRSAAEIIAAVSALTRTPRSALRARGPARRLLLGALAELTEATDVGAAAIVGVHRTTAGRAALGPDRRLVLIERVAGDDRFAVLRDGDLLAEPSWAGYRHLR